MVRSSPGVNPSSERGVGNPSLEGLRGDVCALVVAELDRNKAVSQTTAKRRSSRPGLIGLICRRRVVAPELEFERV